MRKRLIEFMKKDGWILALIIVGALALRVIYLCQVRDSAFFYELGPGTDMWLYYEIATQIVDGDLLAGGVDVSPFYPVVFLPLALLVSKGGLLVTRLLQMIISSCGYAALYFIGRRAFGRKAGLLAAGIAALYAAFFIYEGVLLSEWLLNLFCVLMVLSALRMSETPSSKNAILLGLATGCAIATKPTVMAVVPFLLLWLLLHSRKRKRMIALEVLAVAMMIVATLPFVVRNYNISGEVILVRSNSGYMFFMGNNPSATGAFKVPTGLAAEHLEKRFEREAKDEGDRDRIAYQEGLRFFRENPGAAARLMWRKFLMFWGPREIGNNLSVKYYRQVVPIMKMPFLTFGVLLPFALLGMVVGLRKWRSTAPLFLFVGIYMLAIVLFLVTGRYRLAVVPFLIVFAAGGIVWMLERLKDKGHWKFATCAIAIVALELTINSTAIDQRLRPLLFSEGTVDRKGDVVVVRDDITRPTPYKTFVGVGDRVRKELFIPEKTKEIESVRLAIYCAITNDTTLDIVVNDHRIEYRHSQPSGLSNTYRGWLEIPFGLDRLKVGMNTITIGIQEGGRLAIFVDDFYDYDRSALSRQGGEWQVDRLDETTYLTSRSCHIADGEYKIRLVFSAPSR